MVPFPASGHYLQSVRESSHALRLAANIQITDESITRLLTSPAFTSTFSRVSKEHGLSLPLRFSSHLDELNFISILSILNFASGYRVPLHVQTKRGAWDNIRALMFGLYISSTTEGDLLSAKGLRNLELSKIAELMGISLHVEKPHEKMHGVVVGELGGPLYELVKMITRVLNETGEVLENSGYGSLGAFVAEALKSTEKLPSGARADVIVERLVRAFPAFRDMSEVLGQPIYCFKKALFLVEAIAIKFGSLSPPPFPIPATDHLPVFSDNVLPSMLIHLGVVDLSSSPSLSRVFSNSEEEGEADAKLKTLLAASPESAGTPRSLPSPPKAGPEVSNDQAYILRAAAIDACEMMVAKAKTLTLPSVPSEDPKGTEWIHSITLPDLDMWLWAGSKDRPDYRQLERIVAKDTVYF